MANRLLEAIKRANTKATTLSEAKIKSLHRTLKTSWQDLVRYQQLQAWGYASGRLSLNEATLLYKIYGGESPSPSKWGNLTIGEKIVGTKAADELLDMRTKSRRRNPRQALYESFHGSPPERTRRVKVPKPEGPMIAIGRAVRIEYEPYGSSQHKKTRFYHNFGDTGEGNQPNKPILATDTKGENLFLIPTSGNYPHFTERGIIG